jgi:hypothetical protein
LFYNLNLVTAPLLFKFRPAMMREFPDPGVFECKELTKSLSKSTRNDRPRLMGGNKTIEPVGRNSFFNLAVPKFLNANRLTRRQ